MGTSQNGKAKNDAPQHGVASPLRTLDQATCSSCAGDSIAPYCHSPALLSPPQSRLHTKAVTLGSRTLTLARAPVVIDVGCPREVGPESR